MKKNILILGASSDIGIELIKFLIKKEYNITAHCNQNFKQLQKLKKKNNIKIIKKNFSKLNDKNIKGVCTKYFNENYGCFVNLIGYTDQKSYLNSNINSLIKILSINTIIPMFVLRHILKKMVKKKYGRIVNGSSIGVKFGGGENSFNYSLSKHLLEFIPNTLRKLASKNIIINNIRIGVTDTKIHKKLKRNKSFLKKRISLIPTGRLASKKEIAEYIYMLLNEKNSFMTNQTVTVSGGE